MKIEQDLNWALLTSISSWRRVRSPSLLELDGSPASLVSYQFVAKERTITQELNLQSEAASKVKWILGFYYFDDTAGYNPLTQRGSAFGGGSNPGFVVDATQATTSLAGYGQVTVPIIDDNTHVTGGLRYTSDVKSIVASRSVLATGAPVAYAYPANYPFRVHQPKLTYKASIDHSFTRDLLAYVSYSRGYKSGNYNITNPTQIPTGPETLDAYEIGVKSELLDHHVRANVAAFYYRFHDKQVQAFVAGRSVQTNAAEAEYKGIDAELNVTPLRGLEFIGGLTYVDNHYVSYPNAVFVTLSPTAGVSGAFNADATGNALAYVDKFSITGTAQYSAHQAFGTVSGQVTVNHHAKYYFDAQEGASQPAYTTLAANLSLTLPSDHFKISLWGQNLTGAHYYAARSFSSGTGDLYNAAAPRTFGVRFGYKM